MTDQEKMEIKEKIKLLHTEMTEIILYNGLAPTTWNSILDEGRATRLEVILKFLAELKDTLWQDMYTIWTQPNMTSDMWHSYKWFFNRPELVEQKQMAEAAKRLKRRWRLFRDELQGISESTETAQPSGS